MESPDIELEEIFEALVDIKEIYDGITCWSIRKLSSILGMSYADLRHAHAVCIRDLKQRGNKAGYSLSIFENNGLLNRRAEHFSKHISVEVEVDGYSTEIDDWLINSFVFYQLAPTCGLTAQQTRQLKDFIVLESCGTFNDNQ